MSTPALLILAASSRAKPLPSRDNFLVWQNTALLFCALSRPLWVGRSRPFPVCDQRKLTSRGPPSPATYSVYKSHDSPDELLSPSLMSAWWRCSFSLLSRCHAICVCGCPYPVCGVHQKQRAVTRNMYRPITLRAGAPNPLQNAPLFLWFPSKRCGL